MRTNDQKIAQKLEGRCLVFLGMMGCGKSAIGKAVAAKLGFGFADSDAEIEKAANMSVADLFETYGEPEFRRLEARVIERLMSEGQMVIALGGGAFMTAETRKLILEQAVSIWLNVDLDVLVARVKRRPGKRPLLAKGDPEQILRELLEVREPVYGEADIHVSVGNGTKTETRDLVIEALASHLCDA